METASRTSGVDDQTRVTRFRSSASWIVSRTIVVVASLVGAGGVLDTVRRAIRSMPLDWTRVCLSVALLLLVVSVATILSRKPHGAVRGLPWLLLSMGVVSALLATPETANWLKEMRLPAFLSLLLEYVRALAWPLVVGIAIVIFRSPVSELISRIESGKGFGAEFRTRSVEQVGQLAKHASEEALQATDTPPEDEAEDSGQLADEDEPTEAEVFFNLVSGTNALEQAALRLAERVGVEPKSRGRFAPPSARNLFESLNTAGVIPPSAMRSLSAALEVRNRAVHGVGTYKRPSTQAMKDATESINNLIRVLESSAIRFVPFADSSIRHGMDDSAVF
jgi:hypothetical protein